MLRNVMTGTVCREEWASVVKEVMVPIAMIINPWNSDGWLGCQSHETFLNFKHKFLINAALQ
jgi:hypothetical protein